MTTVGLARSSRDLLNTLADVAKVGAGFKSLRDASADTTTAHGRLMIGLAEFERELILARTSEGRARAVARGVGREYYFPARLNAYVEGRPGGDAGSGVRMEASAGAPWSGRWVAALGRVAGSTITFAPIFTRA